MHQCRDCCGGEDTGDGRKNNKITNMVITFVTNFSNVIDKLCLNNLIYNIIVSPASLRISHCKGHGGVRIPVVIVNCME